MNTLKKKYLVPAMVCLGLAGMTSSAQAQVVISFEQIGNDVRIEANGTMLGIVDDNWDGYVVPPFTNAYNPSNNDDIIIRNNRGPGNQSVFRSTAGLAVQSGVTIAALAGNGDPTSTGTFGYQRVGARLRWDISAVAANNFGTVDLAFIGSVHNITIANTTLAALGAQNYNNLAVWTADATNPSDASRTLFLNTGPGVPAVVPEPSNALLLGLGILVVGLRRKR